jgi:hypothetical protein
MSYLKWLKDKPGTGVSLPIENTDPLAQPIVLDKTQLLREI